MSLRIALLAVLAVLVLPASAHASLLRVSVLVHGPGKIGGHLTCESTVGTSGTKSCGTVEVGSADEVVSPFAADPARRRSRSPKGATRCAPARPTRPATRAR